MIRTCWAAQRCALLGHDTEDKGEENTSSEQVKPPSGFNRGKTNAFGKRDVKRDEEDVGHGEFAEDRQQRQVAWTEALPLDQGEGDEFGIRGNDGKEGDDEGEEYVCLPKRPKAGENRDFTEAKDRQDPGAHQGREPSDRVEDQECEGGEAEGHGRAVKL